MSETDGIRYAVERRQQILTLARQDGRVAVNDLAASLRVAPETVRRDLADLEKQGLVQRVHGGALPVDRIGFEGTVSSRAERNQPEKARIAAKALTEIRDAEVIFLDEGSTAVMLARALDPERPLTVVTGSIPVITELSAHPRISAILLGGPLRSGSMAASGSWPARMLAEIVVDVAFIGTNGLTVERGLTCPDLGVATVKRAAVAAARRSVLLADATKFGRDSFAVFAKVPEMDLVISETSAPRMVVEQIRKQGTPVILT
ncbi:transcriptional regulator, DeoR family [Nakamurella panacisegetis]|uniref:Lactose phosphotransferase system repressor n=1 Tax=Nakamurella panacisegetis TaxID=1090615 RepID=A0A1H0JCV8_9ACTN|nr:DeoR/GlpR family DNA-binding transcription regulator [Nakamurella panacisegetis]SDO41484.1 transcriptional regulator, DeoR family [Nakamurella panacisegetis]